MKNQKRKLTLKDVVKAAHAEGIKVSVGLESRRMPMRFPGDPEAVSLLLDECERQNALGNKWLTASVPNQVAGEMLLRNGWAMGAAAAWLRCKLKGELLPESKSK